MSFIHLILKVMAIGAAWAVYFQLRTQYRHNRRAMETRRTKEVECFNTVNKFTQRVPASENRYYYDNGQLVISYRWTRGKCSFWVDLRPGATPFALWLINQLDEPKVRSGSTSSAKDLSGFIAAGLGAIGAIDAERKSS